ncbi:hypothetical protein [Halosegnis marinus]|uniref:Uncharacterized protein n=1 Tax=Halosegnis marinus TaxID=3034023 RepID=A0ABD5ZL18_9EURY|nr:hypothetical protein [Halosegnis sp. DT85]
MNTDVPGGRVGRWLLVTGSRRHVILALVLAVYVAMFPLGIIAPDGVNALLTDRSSVAALLNTLLSGVILLVSVVVSVASLFVSQELSPVGRQQERVDSTREFRRQTEDIIDRQVSPAEPAAFLRAITRAVLQRAQELDDEVAEMRTHPGIDEATPGDLDAEVDAYLGHVAANTERVNRALDSAEYGTFEMLRAALEYDYAEQLFALRRLRSRHGAQLTDAASDTVDELEEALQFFLAAREYFKSLYLEREFSNLTSDLLYVSLPAIIVVSYAVLAVDLQFIDGAVFGISYVLLFAGAAYTVALAPFIVLTAYVLRVATVSRRTLSAGPFILDGNGERDRLDG